MTHFKLNSRTFRFLGRLVAVVAAFLVTGTFVVRGSQAAFTDTTDNMGSSVTAGNVDLIDDDSTFLFNVPTMTPGDSVENCILVTYQGSIADPALVKSIRAASPIQATLATTST